LTKPTSRLERILSWLEQPKSVLVIAVIGIALVLPSLGDRLVLDDHVLALLLRDESGIRGLRSNPLDLFRFTTGDPKVNRELMDEGALLPWWSDERHLNAFLRPLSSLTHWLDFRLWPNSPMLMHLHSILWYGALLLVVAYLYRAMALHSRSPGWLCGFAFLLFALDDAHGPTVGWIANRNALVATTFALLALCAHHGSRSRNWRPGAYLGPLLFACGLLAGESAVAVFGFLLAYALLIDRGSIARSLTSISGFVLVLLCWIAIHKGMDRGSFGSGAYHDPGREPVAFLFALCRNLPVLLSAQLGIPTADFAFWGPPWMFKPLLILSIVTVAVVLWLAWPVLRSDTQSRFWALGTVLAAVPVSASVPGERLLLVISVGASPLVARILFPLFDRSRSTAARRVASPRHLCLFALLAIHLCLASLLLPVRAYSMNLLGQAVDRADQSIPMTDAIRQQSVVIVTTPFVVMASYLQVMRESRRQPRPKHLYWLSTASSTVQIKRVAERTLQITPRSGFIYTPLEKHYRGNARKLAKGKTVELSEMIVRITETTRDGRPRSASFTFREPLNSECYRFVVWSNGRYRRFAIPELGTGVALPQHDFYRVVISTLLSIF
jgi:hypothetical protein